MKIESPPLVQTPTWRSSTPTLSPKSYVLIFSTYIISRICLKLNISCSASSWYPLEVVGGRVGMCSYYARDHCTPIPLQFYPLNIHYPFEYTLSLPAPEHC